jgi:hypothetical protein
MTVALSGLGSCNLQVTAKPMIAVLGDGLMSIKGLLSEGQNP